MPLIIITGYPSSGKSHRANQIHIDFEERIRKPSVSETSTTRKIITIPSHHASLDPRSTDVTEPAVRDQTSNLRDQLYCLASAEKVARAAEFSAIKRALNKNDVVIADGLNYIKGFRYQLWCEAKAAATRCVVVHVATREDECEKWNKERIDAHGWDFPNQDNSPQHNEEMKVGGVNVRVGRNVIGELEPESHTAIYGDKIVEQDGSRSRSSSTGAIVSGDEENEQDIKQQRQARNDDIMTLKSLYISDARQDSRQSLQVSRTPGTLPEQQSTSLSEQEISPAPTEPPSPKSALPYSPSTLKSLLMRYEPPSPFTRWDTPLFTIPTSDIHPPYESIWNAIFPPPAKSMSKKALSQRSQASGQADNDAGKVEDVRQHAATVLPKATASDALQILESGTADVVKSILAAARAHGMANGEGGELSFSVPEPSPSSTSTNTTENPEVEVPGIQLAVNLPLNTPLSQPMLQRLRRKYTQIQRGSIAHGKGHVSGREEVIRNFTQFLAAEWGTGG